MLTEATKAAIKRELAGMSEADALTALAQVLRPDVFMARVDRVREPGTAWPPVALRAVGGGGDAVMTEEEAKFVRSLGHDPEKVAAAMQEARARKRTKGGPVTLSGQEREALQRLGHDPDHVLAAMKAKDAADYRARVGGGR